MKNKRIIIILFFLMQINQALSIENDSEKFWDFLEYKLIKKPSLRTLTIESVLSEGTLNAISLYTFYTFDKLITDKLKSYNQTKYQKNYLVKIIDKFMGYSFIAYSLFAIPMFHFSVQRKINKYSIEELEDILTSWELYRKECPEQLLDMLDSIFLIYQKDLEFFRKQALIIVKGLVNTINRHKRINALLKLPELNINKKI